MAWRRNNCERPAQSFARQFEEKSRIELTPPRVRRWENENRNEYRRLRSQTQRRCRKRCGDRRATCTLPKSQRPKVREESPTGSYENVDNRIRFEKRRKRS